MNNWKVYCYTGKNNKKYVGITSRSVQERAGHEGYCYRTDKNSKFGNAINKYGFDFFTCEILADNLEKEEANKLEQFYIQYFDSINNGYNISMGGEGNSKIDYQEVINLWNQGYNITEIKEKMNISRRGISAAFNAFNIEGKERIKRSAGQYLTFPVYQYDLDGNFIREYNSAAEAERELGICNILRCLKNKRCSAGGFQWSKEKVENMGNVDNRRKQGNHKVIYQYDIQTKQLLNEYNSTAEAARIVNGYDTYIRKRMKEHKSAYGFLWSYEKMDKWM